MSDDTVGLAVTNEELRARFHRDKLSPSGALSLNSNGACAARAFSEKAFHSEPSPFEPTETGTMWHEVAEDLYNLPAELRTKHSATELLLAKTAKVFDPDKERVDWATLFAEVRNAGWGMFGLEDATKVHVASTEEEIDNVEIGGVPFRGIIDRTENISGGGLEIGDYKTSGKVPTQLAKYGDAHGDQLRLYFLAKAERGDDVRKAKIIYTRLGIATVKQVAVSKPKLATTRKMFQIAWKRQNRYMDTGVFPTEVSPLCGWCPLVAVCPAAKAAGKEDRSGGAVPGLVIPDKTGLAAVSPATGTDDSGRYIDSPGFREDELTDTTTAAIDRVVDTQNRTAAPEADGCRTHEYDEEEPNLQETEMVDKSTLELVPTSTDDIPILGDGKPYIEILDGALNIASYAAGAAMTLTTQAYRCLKDADAPTTTDNVREVSRLFASICDDVVKLLTDAHDDWNGGAHTRARHTLFASLEADPLPWGKDVAGWKQWTRRTMRRCEMLANESILLYYSTPENRRPDFGALAGIDAVTADDKVLAAREPQGAWS